MSDYTLIFDKVDFTYRGDWLQRVHALKQVSFTVPRGASFGFLGANGAGKSTSIKLLMGLLHGHTGSIKLFGEELGPPALREKIGYLPEQPFFYENLQVQEYLNYLGKLSRMKRAQIQERKAYVYEVLDLGDLRRRRLSSFSKGMRQRFGLAQAIFHQPEFLVLDEPFSGLDPLWRARFRQVMRAEQERGATLCFSSHVLSDVEDLCDTFAVIDHGVILEQGRLQDLLGTAPLIMYGSGPAPAEAELQSPDAWTWTFGEDERERNIQIAIKCGASILRIERQRQALEEAFVARVREFHSAGSAAVNEVSS